MNGGVGEVPLAPAPWRLAGDAHALFLRMPRQFGLRDHGFADSADARPGGLGMLAFIRYRASDVGPYDELMWVPLRNARFGGRREHSITRIYVSREASVVNGRRNWGLPKAGAGFDVERSGARGERVRVSVEGRTAASFVVEPGSLGVPFGTGVVPQKLRTLVQERDGRRFRFAPSASGTLRTARFDGLQFDAALFPDVSVGRVLAAVSLTGFRLDFPAAEVEAVAAGSESSAS
jgi:hypothetical protein